MSLESLPNMRSLSDLDEDQQQYYRSRLKLEGDMAEYWAEISDACDAIPNDQKSQRARILVRAIAEIPQRFPGDDGDIILRKVHSQLGLMLEKVALFDLKDSPNIEVRQNLLLTAAEQYILSDEKLGIWSDCSLRAINCLSAAGRGDLAQQIANQAFGEGLARIVPENSPQAPEARMLMKRGRRIGPDDSEIYVVSAPPEGLN